MQLSFGGGEDLAGRKKTRRKLFLAEMEQVVPWEVPVALIELRYPTFGRLGRQP